MKLYTEEQIMKANEIKYMYHSADDIINLLTPIELPSDEEIEKSSPFVYKDSHDYYRGKYDGFIDGAKWVIEKIKQQDNGR